MNEEGYSFNKQRNTTLDLIRGVAILIVVIGHAIQANISEGKTSFIWTELILVFQMPLLFFISGYSAGFSFPCENLRLFIQKKFARLFVPYLSWAMLHFVLMALMPGDYRKFGLIDFFKEIFLSDFWFLRMLFLFFMAMWLCDLLLLVFHWEKHACITVMVLFAATALMVLLKKIPLISASANAWYYLWFVGGYISYVAVESKKLDRWWRRQTFRNFAMGSSIALMIIVAATLRKYTIPSKIVAIVFTLGIVVFLCAIEEKLPGTVRNAMEDLGKNTLPIYAVHWCLLFSPLWRFGVYTRLFYGLPLVLSSLFTAIGWIAICIFAIKFLRTNKMVRFILLGEK